jgi:YidC/Oxa1 family membrane protein insertase
MVLYVGSQLLSSWLTPSTGDPNQKMLMCALPIVFSIFILVYAFPAGLLVYWITSAGAARRHAATVECRPAAIA